MARCKRAQNRVFEPRCTAARRTASGGIKRFELHADRDALRGARRCPATLRDQDIPARGVAMRPNGCLGTVCASHHKLSCSLHGSYHARLDAAVSRRTRGSRAIAPPVNRTEPSEFAPRAADDNALFAGGGEAGFLLSRIDWA